MIRTIKSVSSGALSLPPLCSTAASALPRSAFVAALSSASDARRLAAFQLASYEDFVEYFPHSAKSSEASYVKTFASIVLGLHKQHGEEVVDFVSRTVARCCLYPSSPLAREFFGLDLLKQLLAKPGAHIAVVMSNLECMRPLISEKVNSLWDVTRGEALRPLEE